MQISLYSNFSKKQNSTKRPIGSGTTVSAHLKEGTSVLNPTFIFDAVNISINEVYAFGRYYFVDDMTVSSENVCEVHCSVDVLATYKSEIGSSSQHVIRAESAYDEYLTDNMYPASNITDRGVTEIPLSWSKDGGVYVWGLIGDQHSAAINRGCVNYFILNANQSKILANNLQNPTGGLFTSSVPTDFVSSIVYIPLVITGASEIPVNDYKLGSEWEFTFGCLQWTSPGSGPDMSTGIYTTADQGVSLPHHPQYLSKGKFVDYAPYSTYKLFAGPLGETFIDRHLLNNTDVIAVRYDIDMPTGACRFCLMRTSVGVVDNIFMELNGMLGAETSVGSVKIGSIGATTAVASSVLSTAINLAAQNYAGAAVSAISAIGTGIAAASPQVHQKGSNASRCDFYNPYILSEFYELPADDASKYGRPLCQTKTISSLSGYIKCGNASLPLAAFDMERQMVEGLLNSGFYYE